MQLLGNAAYTPPPFATAMILGATITTNATAGNRQLAVGGNATENTVVAASQTNARLLAGGAIVTVGRGQSLTILNGQAADVAQLEIEESY